MRQHIRFAALACGLLSIASLASAGQLSGTLSGPSLGYVWSASDGKIHPLLGMPGNATIGNAQDLGFSISQAVSLNGRHFLASTDANPSVLFINGATNPVSITAISDAPANPSRIAVSRVGTAASLYYEDQQQVLVVTGLPSTPKVSHVLEVSAAGGPLSRMTVNDDGSLVLYSASQGTHDALFAWTPVSGYRLLTTTDSIADIALTPGGDSVIADGMTNEIFLIADPKGSAARVFLADDRNGVLNPTTVAVSNAGQIYVVNGGTDTILTLDSAGNLLGSQHCGCEVAGLFPLKDSLYRLSSRTDTTLYLLEAGTNGDRVSFVPPGQENQ
jgi:hypothetical protein